MNRWICISGLISCGKTTLSYRLGKYCAENAIRCKLLPEFYSKALYDKIVSNMQLVDSMMLSHRIQMSLDAPEIAPNYDVVLMERGVIDHMALIEAFEQCGMLPRDYVIWCKKVVEQLNPPNPDQCLFLDVDPAEAISRRDRRGHAYDKVFDLKFMTVLRESYLRLIRQHYSDPIILDWSNYGQELELGHLVERLTAACPI
jgi:thymidylate kinase